MEGYSLPHDTSPRLLRIEGILPSLRAGRLRSRTQRVQQKMRPQSKGRVLRGTVMPILLALVLSSGVAHAASPPSLAVSFSNYGWQLVDQDEDHAVALACFQWRLGHQWQGRRDTLAAALSYERIRLHQKAYNGELFWYSSSFDRSTSFYSMPFEFRWTRRWSRSWATTLRLTPALTAEEFADENRSPIWGELLVLHKGLGLGVGRLEVSGRLRWWPLVNIRHQWRGIRVESLFPRYLEVQKGLLKLRARLEGATYLIEDDWDAFQPLYFSHLALGATLLVSEGPLAIAFELGRAVRRRFEVAGSKPYPHQTSDAGSATSRTTRWEPSAESKPYPYQTIDAGWYIRTSLSYAP